jgi:hypothetical protein
MTRRALPVLLAAATLALAGCGGPSEADAHACNVLNELGDDAVDGQPDAIYALATEFDDVTKDGLSEDLEAQAVRVGGSAFIEQTGGASDLPTFIGRMHDECVDLGWKA